MRSLSTCPLLERAGEGTKWSLDTSCLREPVFKISPISFQSLAGPAEGYFFPASFN